jgi:hypothetical protein
MLMHLKPGQERYARAWTRLNPPPSGGRENRLQSQHPSDWQLQTPTCPGTTDMKRVTAALRQVNLPESPPHLHEQSRLGVFHIASLLQGCCTCSWHPRDLLTTRFRNM